MSLCPDSNLLQDYLDGELPERRAVAMRAHLEACERCAAEVALYRRAFACLDRMPLAAPSPALTERILDRVVPARVRRRWVKTFGWSYAGGLAASVAIVLVGLTHPGARAALASFSGEVFTRLVQAVVFTLNVLSFALLGLSQGWGALAATGERVAPFVRVFSSLIASPVILVTLVAALASCTAMLWWLRPRETHSTREIRHVGLLGF